MKILSGEPGYATSYLHVLESDADNASYTNIRRFINSRAAEVPKDAVQVEEMINRTSSTVSYNLRISIPSLSIPSHSDAPWNPRNTGC